ncbi:MAG: pyruvate formate lyase-activating protein [Ruminococcaceae bacterium]|nr:pyruvate formate lyase-activating protein [Oscillospiraceae bacterium]
MRIFSLQSLGTVDGPGVRYVVFMQGCPLRCPYCHNPESWDADGGYETDLASLTDKILRCKEYIKNGGVTFSGGEPLLQAKELKKAIELLKKNNIHTAIDTSGCIISKDSFEALKACDLVLLDIKMPDDEMYRKYINIPLSVPLETLDYLEKINKPVWIRYVNVPSINDSEECINKLENLLKPYTCIEKLEILPFKKLCIEKYKKLNIPFPFENIEAL